mgnify:CR=1 FL=1
MSDLTVIDKPEEPPKGEGARPIILAVIVLTVLSIVLGGGIGFLMSSSIEENVVRKEKKAEAVRWAPPPKSYNDDIVLVKLNPVTTNLMSPDSIFIKVEASLVVPKALGEQTSVMDAMSADISQDILNFLRTVTLAQIQGPAGLQNLREDLNDRGNIRSEGKVRELILETMVVQ